MKNLFKRNSIYIAWALALFATLGSFFFSNILNFSPCILCWYQRIFMFPLVLILGVGILKKDRLLPLYALPLSIIGLGISLYHNLLYYELLPSAATPCITGVSCTTRFLDYFGFISIPLLSLTAFSIISISIITHQKHQKNLSDGIL